MSGSDQLTVDLNVLRLLTGRLQGLAHRLVASGEVVAPSASDLGAPVVADAYDVLTSRWRAVGGALTADVGVAVGHLRAAVADYGALERGISDDARDSGDEVAAAAARAARSGSA